MKIAIVVSDYHKSIASQMLKSAEKKAKEIGMEVVVVKKVLGAFEVPLALQRVLSRHDVEGVVVLGAIVQGETSHDEVIAYTVADKVADLSLKYGKPVGYGITGPRMALAQAKARAVEFGERCVEAIARFA